MNKKGDLSLSVNTIVIIVLAITLLGLGLTFIQSIVGGATDKLKESIDDVDLSEQPTSAKPLIIPRELEIKLGSTKNVNIGFYNKGPGTVSKIKPIIKECITITNEPISGTVTLGAPSKDSIAPSEFQGYLTVLTIEDVAENRYICTLTMEGEFGDNSIPSTDFYLKVIS